MSLLDRLITRESAFFDPIAAIAELAAENAVALRALLQDPMTAPARLPDLHARRKRLDDLADKLEIRLAQAFIAPIDAEDIAQLGYDLRKLGDGLDDMGRLVVALHIQTTPPEVVALSAALVDATSQLQEAMAQLRRRHRGNIREITSRIAKIEHDADDVYHEAMSTLFRGSVEPMEILRWKDVYDGIENLIDMVHHTGSLLDVVVMKSL